MVDALSLIECGGDLNAPSGTISSPNYPNLYPHNRLCRWKITVPQGRRVTLTFNDLRLEDHNSCTFDYVEVRALHFSYCRKKIFQGMIIKSVINLLILLDIKKKILGVEILVPLIFLLI